MVKGNSRQVIVVPSPDPELFEQAIFILKAHIPGKKGVTDRELLRQARAAAEAWLPHTPIGPWHHRLLWLGIGAGAVAVAWLLTGAFW